MISDRLLKKFKDIYLKTYKIELTDEEATRQATDLLNLMQVLLKPDNGEFKAK